MPISMFSGFPAVDVFAVADYTLADIDGIEATRQVAGSGGEIPRILILTTFDLDENVYDALRAGVSGFLLKDVTAERLFDTVRCMSAEKLQTVMLDEVLVVLQIEGRQRRLIGQAAGRDPHVVDRARPSAPGR